MKTYRLKLFTDSVIKLAIIVILMIAASTKLEYGFYVLLRWLVMTASVYFIYKSYKKKQIGFVILFVVIAILFNPFDKIWFHRATWQLIDYFIAIIFTLTIIYDWLIDKNKQLDE
jgi:hypothetical protein